jgi:2-(1,2-epoxy-1,2-dihydrophenyl)acetyl-CoA isomerase
MSEGFVECQIEDGIAKIVLNDPESLNSLSPPLVFELGQLLNRLENTDNRIRCLVLTGKGRAFSSGGNLKVMNDPSFCAQVTSSLLQHVYHPLFRQLRDFPSPLVTSVNGVAAGAGMSLALMGDIILAAQSAYFLQAFRNVGLVPDCGSSWMLPRMIGLARARELTLLGERLSAETAFEWGLINHLVEDDALQDATLGVAKRIADGPVECLTAIRRLYWASLHNSFEEQIDLEDQYQQVAKSGPEVAEGLSAFREKRVANFRQAICE